MNQRNNNQPKEYGKRGAICCAWAGSLLGSSVGFGFGILLSILSTGLKWQIEKVADPYAAFPSLDGTTAEDILVFTAMGAAAGAAAGGVAGGVTGYGIGLFSRLVSREPENPANVIDAPKPR